jgi:hypothetical protein
MYRLSNTWQTATSWWERNNKNLWHAAWAVRFAHFWRCPYARLVGCCALFSFSRRLPLVNLYVKTFVEKCGIAREHFSKDWTFFYRATSIHA